MNCTRCNAELIESIEPIDTSFRGEQLSIEGVRHLRCPQCGEIEIPADELASYSEKLKQAYRDKTDMLLPEDIRALRTRYGLRQKEFERVIGVSFPTCSRWESGTSIPSLPANKLMQEAIENPPTMRRLMKRAGLSPQKKKGSIVALPPRSHANRS